jgi:methionyl-tRNA synthetase
MPPNESRQKVFLGVAWPYSNGSLHIGQIAGAYLPPDIFGRYHRCAGNDVLMVSGSDQHGTPITVRAEEEGVTPGEIAGRFHAEFLESWKQLGISFDLFTTTGTENHARVSQEIFLKLLERGDIYEDTMTLPYCATEGRFLLDRYVEGTCPHCGYNKARGDQCDNCGRVLDPVDLKDRRCKFDGSEPELRESRHFFHRLSAYNARLREWLDMKTFWRKPVVNWARGWIEEGLKDRSITRDVTWGVKIPVEGWEDKRIYVWFEAVIGYLSATIEWAERAGQPEAWRDYWMDPECRHYYFIGKDNIPFHTLIWPAYLMGYSEATSEAYNLPYDVPANQYQTLKGGKASTSLRTAVFLPDFLSRYDPDPLRYYCAATMPELADSDFTWDAFVHRNNDELVAAWGNLVNRVLTFTYRNFDRAVPMPGMVTAEDTNILGRVDAAIEETGVQIEACHFRLGLEAAMGAVRDVNKYVEDSAPWKLLKEDRERCATVLHTALGAINGLKVALYPYLPFTSQTLHGYLGYEGPVEAAGWLSVPMEPGRPIADAKPLFRKLDPAVVEEEEVRMAG